MQASPAAPSSTPEPAAPKIYVEENNALPLISIAVAVRTGASTDPPKKEGLTRIMMRMLRRGCRGMTAHEIEERIDALGAELAADVSSSVLTLHVDVISRSLDKMVDLLATLMAEPTFDEAELGRLLRETQGEIVEARDNDRSLATRHFRRMVFDGHPYGRRLGGTIPSVSTITQSEVRAHYRRHFVKSNLAIAFAGDISEARAHELSERLIAGLPDGVARPEVIPAPATQAGRRLVFVDKPERTQTQILIGGLGSHPRDADHIPLHVATTIFGGTFTSRMMREIRSERGWSYAAYARLPYDRERDAFSMWTFPAAKDASACIGLELSLLSAWYEKGISERELAFAKRYLVRSHAFDIDTAQKRVHQKLDVDLFDLPADYHTGYIEHVQAVTTATANEAVKRRISVSDLSISVVGTRADIGDSVAGAVSDLSKLEVVAYDEE
ncbi:MAG TPA: pitrilysin family protein [Polyangiaceae bacterium]|jgi:zinc protease